MNIRTDTWLDWISYNLFCLILAITFASVNFKNFGILAALIFFLTMLTGNSLVEYILHKNPPAINSGFLIWETAIAFGAVGGKLASFFVNHSQSPIMSMYTFGIGFGIISFTIIGFSTFKISDRFSGTIIDLRLLYPLTFTATIIYAFCSNWILGEGWEWNFSLLLAVILAVMLINHINRNRITDKNHPSIYNVLITAIIVGMIAGCALATYCLIYKNRQFDVYLRWNPDYPICKRIATTFTRSIQFLPILLMTMGQTLTLALIYIYFRWDKKYRRFLWLLLFLPLTLWIYYRCSYYPFRISNLLYSDYTARVLSPTPWEKFSYSLLNSLFLVLTIIILMWLFDPAWNIKRWRKIFKPKTKVPFSKLKKKTSKNQWQWRNIFPPKT